MAYSAQPRSSTSSACTGGPSSGSTLRAGHLEEGGLHIKHRRCLKKSLIWRTEHQKEQKNDYNGRRLYCGNPPPSKAVYSGEKGREKEDGEGEVVVHEARAFETGEGQSRGRTRARVVFTPGAGLCVRAQGCIYPWLYVDAKLPPTLAGWWGTPEQVVSWRGGTSEPQPGAAFTARAFESGGYAGAGARRFPPLSRIRSMPSPSRVISEPEPSGSLKSKSRSTDTEFVESGPEQVVETEAVHLPPAFGTRDVRGAGGVRVDMPRRWRDGGFRRGGWRRKGYNYIQRGGDGGAAEQVVSRREVTSELQPGGASTSA
ncbi:hypothetical protein K438DRAFT_1998509 [Mycena galopus ATCC 62051]|nr:hypothetical protein K438DRAFT_1998509 [Mycena galopus ATCC 62051]